MTDPTIHLDADLLSAFAEDALPAHEREPVLAHLALCPDCRAMLALSLPEQDELLPKPVAVPTRRAWFSGWRLLWAAVPALAAVLLLTVLLPRHRAPAVAVAPVPPTIARVEPLPPPLLPPPSATAAAPRRQVPAPHPPAPAMQAEPNPAPSGTEDQAAGAVIDSQQISNLPLQGRNDTVLQAKVPSTVGSIHGAAQASAGLASARAAAPAPAPPKAQPAAPAETVDVSAAAAEISVNNAAIDLPSATAIHALPSKLAVAASVRDAGQTVALDTAGGVFQSKDGGRHWKSVPNQWQGRAVSVQSIPVQPVSAAVVPVRTVAAAPAKPLPPLAAQQGYTLRLPTPAPGTAALAGVVTDQTGAVIPGTAIQVTGPGASRSIKTDAQGRYAVDGLPPGDYKVQAQAPGFATQQAALTLPPAQRTQQDLRLNLGSESETVTVNASPVESKRMRKAESAAPVFMLTTESGARWESSDGLHWRPSQK